MVMNHLYVWVRDNRYYLSRGYLCVRVEYDVNTQSKELHVRFQHDDTLAGKSSPLQVKIGLITVISCLIFVSLCSELETY